MAPTPQPNRSAEDVGATGVPGEVPRLVTARLVLDRLTAADAPAFAAYRSLPEVCRYQSFAPADAAAAASFIDELAAVPWDTPGAWCQLAVRERAGAGGWPAVGEQAGGALVGDLGVHFVDAEQAELGFTIAPAFQRRGFAAEAVAAVLSHLFGEMGKHRVTASVDPRNEASVGLLRHLGWRQEAHFRESLRFKGEWADDVVFAVLASEWAAGAAPAAGGPA